MENFNQTDNNQNDEVDEQAECNKIQNSASKLKAFDEFLRRSPFVQTPNR